MKHMRLIPLVLFATASLLVLKGMGIIRNGHYTLPSEQQQELVVAGGGGAPAPASGGIAAALAARSAPKECPPQLGNGVDPKSENILPEKLTEKRKELEARLQEVEFRENLVKAAEKRLDQAGGRESGGGSQIVNGQVVQKKKAQEDVPDQIKSLVTMYDNMKPKDAGVIFDKLDMSVMSQLALKLKPAKMAEILAAMNPEIAQKLTTELVNQSRKVAQLQGMGFGSNDTMNLPKIEGTMQR